MFYTGMIKSAGQISYPVLQHSQQILSALNNVAPDLQKLSGSKKAVSAITEKTGIELIQKGLKIKSDNKTISLSTPDKFTLLIKIQDALSKEIKEMQIQNSMVKLIKGFNSKKEDISGLLSNILECVDFPILKLRKFFMQENVTSLIEKLSPKAAIDTKCSELANDIKTLFEEIHAKLGSVKHPSTRQKVQYGYSSIKQGLLKSQQIEFTQIGIPKADYMVNIVKDKKNIEHLVIKVEDNEYIMIRPDGTVLKDGNLNRIYNTGKPTAFYSQKELDIWAFKDKLTTLRDELLKYKEYLQNNIQERNEVKEFYSTSDIGTLDTQTLKLLKDVTKLYSACKSKILKIKDAPRKEAFKKKYRIETVMSSPTLIFKNMSLTGEEIHLAFPKLHGKVCTKILVISQNGDIKNSWFIEDDKLVKFNASNQRRSKRSDTITHYYSKEEIDNSGLKEVLERLKSRLSTIKT